MRTRYNLIVSLMMAMIYFFWLTRLGRMDKFDIIFSVSFGILYVVCEIQNAISESIIDEGERQIRALNKTIDNLHTAECLRRANEKVSDKG